MAFIKDMNKNDIMATLESITSPNETEVGVKDSFGQNNTTAAFESVTNPDQAGGENDIS